MQWQEGAHLENIDRTHYNSFIVITITIKITIIRRRIIRIISV